MKLIFLLGVILALAFNTACSMTVEQAPTQKPQALAQASAPQAPDTVASYAYDGASIRLSIPAGWTYEIDAHDAEMGQFSITFWPEEQPGAKIMLCHYASPFGVCGTGLTTQQVAFDNGLTGSMGTYSDLDSWSYIAFEGDYVAHNEGIGLWWKVYGDQALDILGTAVLGEEAA